MEISKQSTLLLTWAKPACLDTMILIDSKENLLSWAIKKKLQSLSQDDIFLMPRSHSLGVEIPIPQSSNKGDISLVKYLVITEYPFNVYEIYNQIKNFSRNALGFKKIDIHIHVIIKINMQDLFMVEQIRFQCAHLGDLSKQIPPNSHGRLRSSFTCVYNVFGMVNSTIMQMDSNSVQSLLYHLKNLTEPLVIPYGENEMIIGTNVEDAASEFVLKIEEASVDSDLHILAINKPITAQMLLNDLQKRFTDRYLSSKFEWNKEINLAALPDILKSNDSLADISTRIISYL
jgi:hypothetical protein